MLRKIMILNINTAVKKTLPFIGYLAMTGFRRDHEINCDRSSSDR